MALAEYDVVIVGAGLSGLTAARLLTSNGVPCLVLDSADRIGGRVKTDEMDGFILDRGFQVFLTSYPEVKQWLDLDTLNLSGFFNGALVWLGDEFQKVADPWRHPAEGVQSIYNKIGTLRDKMKVANLRQQLVNGGSSEIWDISLQPECTSDTYLRKLGLSDKIISTLFRPFLSGIFLEKELSTSSQFFEHIFKVFALGNATLPADGIQAIPRQLAKPLPKNSIRLHSRVTGIESGRVRLTSGELISARTILLASDAADARGLYAQLPLREFNSVSCLYFAASVPPLEEPILALNGVPGKVINNLCVPSQVASTYAPAGQSLVSVSVVGKVQDYQDAQQLLHQVRQELQEWFGPVAQEWQWLKTYSIVRALPQVPVSFRQSQLPSLRLADGLYLR
jgi:phytoene dehydrogenase-like protein